MAFQCVVVTPERQLLDESVSQAIVPAEDGLMGILTDRAPLLAKLGIGPLRVDLAQGKQQYFLIDGGVAQMHDNKLTILTQSAIPADEITAQAAKAQYDETTARQASDAISRDKRQHDLQKARAMQEIARA